MYNILSGRELKRKDDKLMTSKTTESNITEPTKESPCGYAIDSETGSMLLIDMLYAQKKINKATYDNIQKNMEIKNRRYQSMKNNDAAVEARKPVITWKKSVDGLHEFMQLMSRMRKISVINEYLNNRTLYGEEITDNDCYNLVIKERVAYVYLKNNNVAAVV